MNLSNNASNNKSIDNNRYNIDKNSSTGSLRNIKNKYDLSLLHDNDKSCSRDKSDKSIFANMNNNNNNKSNNNQMKNDYKDYNDYNKDFNDYKNEYEKRLRGQDKDDKDEENYYLRQTGKFYSKDGTEYAKIDPGFGSTSPTGTNNQTNPTNSNGLFTNNNRITNIITPISPQGNFNTNFDKEIINEDNDNNNYNNQNPYFSPTNKNNILSIVSPRSNATAETNRKSHKRQISSNIGGQSHRIDLVSPKHNQKSENYSKIFIKMLTIYLKII